MSKQVSKGEKYTYNTFEEAMDAVIDDKDLGAKYPNAPASLVGGRPNLPPGYVANVRKREIDEDSPEYKERFKDAEETLTNLAATLMRSSRNPVLKGMLEVEPVKLKKFCSECGYKVEPVPYGTMEGFQPQFCGGCGEPL